MRSFSLALSAASAAAVVASDFPAPLARVLRPRLVPPGRRAVSAAVQSPPTRRWDQRKHPNGEEGDDGEGAGPEGASGPDQAVGGVVGEDVKGLLELDGSEIVVVVVEGQQQLHKVVSSPRFGEPKLAGV